MPPSTTRSFVSSSSCGGVRFNQGVVDPCKYGDGVEQLEQVAERLGCVVKRMSPVLCPGARGCLRRSAGGRITSSCWSERAQRSTSTEEHGELPGRVNLCALSANTIAGDFNPNTIASLVGVVIAEIALYIVFSTT